jgi:(1->4)-alpha-D-glucan 1-alpha-D-glucosylmutase
VKASREAKDRTSWANPNAAYEDALVQFVRAILEPRDGNLFLTDFLAFQRRILRFGLFNGLTQTLCKLTAPGVPDIYQGDDLWDFSLVDPDNRRPVDYSLRRSLLKELTKGCGATPDPRWVRGLLDTVGDGRAKLYLIWRTLQFRREHEALFSKGAYLPLRVTGEHASKVCAFARRDGDAVAIVIAPRLYLRLLGERSDPPLGADVWGNTRVELPRKLDPTLPPRNVLDGVASPLMAEDPLALAVGTVLQHFPVALLTTTPARN